jgi:two-component system chemotaxis response regulator CheB
VMKHKGAITIAQEEKTCVVAGMPGAAIKLDGATHILPPEKIAPMLERIIATKLHHRS